jgi:enterochelin esterase-like enzyme
VLGPAAQEGLSMDLLGRPLVILLAVLAVGLPAATYLLWSRLRGPRVVRAATRVGLIGLSQVTAVLMVAALINDYGYFYGSWSELLGGSTRDGRVVHARALQGALAGRMAASTLTARSAGDRVTPLPGLATAPARWATQGRLESVTISGGRSGLSDHAFIYLPPQYYQPAWAHRTFPAAEVLTGYPSNDQSLVNRMDYPQVLQQQMAAHRAHPMVLVMLRPTVVPPRDTECTDVPGGPQAETFLAQDVPVAMRDALRVRPVGWGVIGDSTGGYCAAKIAMMHSDVFSAGVALSGYYHTLQDGTTGDLWGGSRVVRSLNDLEWRLQHQPAPPVSLLVTISRQEHGSYGYADTRRFLSLARPPLHVDSLVLNRGGHNFAAWDSELPQAVSWLSAHLGAPV